MLPIRDTIPGRNPPIATWVLILVNSVVFLFELTMPDPGARAVLLSVRPRAGPLHAPGMGAPGWAPD